MKLKLGILFLAVLIELSFLFFLNLKSNNQRLILEINNQKIFVEIVSKPEDLVKGLSGREKLKENQGMFFIFESAGNYGFWMKDMKFPIDIIWIKDNKIVGFEKNIDPQIGVEEKDLKIYYPPEQVNEVLEVSAGVVDERGFKMGDLVSF